jgi:hypothetical protein
MLYLCLILCSCSLAEHACWRGTLMMRLITQPVQEVETEKRDLCYVSKTSELVPKQKLQDLSSWPRFPANFLYFRNFKVVQLTTGFRERRELDKIESERDKIESEREWETRNCNARSWASATCPGHVTFLPRFFLLPAHIESWQHCNILTKATTMCFNLNIDVASIASHSHTHPSHSHSPPIHFPLLRYPLPPLHLVCARF